MVCVRIEGCWVVDYDDYDDFIRYTKISQKVIEFDRKSWQRLQKKYLLAFL